MTRSFFLSCVLLGHDGLSRTLGSAGAALQALARVDLVVEITHVDGLSGALSSAGTAGQALVGDNKSHDTTSISNFFVQFPLKK